MPPRIKSRAELLNEEVEHDLVVEQIEELEKLEKVEAEKRRLRKPESVKENFPQQNNGQSRDKSADTCSTCKKKIDRTKEYFALVLSEEQKINGEIQINHADELKIFCNRDCLEEDN